MKMKIKKRHESRAQFTIIFVVMFTSIVVAIHNLMHGGYIPLWGGLLVGGVISLTREAALRHRAKKLAKAKKQSNAKL